MPYNYLWDFLFIYLTLCIRIALNHIYITLYYDKKIFSSFSYLTYCCSKCR